MKTKIDTTCPCTIKKLITNSCREVKAMRDGQMPKRSWKTFCGRGREANYI